MAQKPQQPSGLVAALARDGYRCNFMQVVATLDEAESAAVLEAVDNIRVSNQKGDYRQTGYTVPWLVGVMNANGYQVTYRMVEWHLKKKCHCGT